MTDVTVLAVGGTGESGLGDERTEVSGLLAGVTAELDNRFRSRWVGYPASFGPVPHRDGISFTASVAVGAHALRAAMTATDGPVMVIGYSQGCVVIRDVLADTGLPTAILRQVVGVGLVADPHQPPDVVAGCDGFGVAGPGPTLPPGLATMWIADPCDVICNASPDSLIRDVADLTAAMSMADVAAWRRQTWQTLRHNALQNAARTSMRPGQWRRDLRRLRVAGAEIAGYLPTRLVVGGVAVRNRRGGRHTAYGSEPLDGRGELTGTAVLAQWMTVQATFAATPDHQVAA